MAKGYEVKVTQSIHATVEAWIYVDAESEAEARLDAAQVAASIPHNFDWDTISSDFMGDVQVEDCHECAQCEPPEVDFHDFHDLLRAAVAAQEAELQALLWGGKELGYP